jgi:site-specific DNA-methyltransferase (adenine-specific)/adenine-specific DNA-methyltransferase
MPVLDWIGKKAVVEHHKQVPFHLLRCNDELSVGEPGSGNLLVQGDNLVALKALLPYYAGQVKCIYIDPPYNTGNENWAYNDNVNSPEMRDWLGKAVGKEIEDLSRHDKWLCMMYPRLALLRQFLKDDGAIFISIDDNEVGHLRLMMDEIFGKTNFVTQIEWQKRYTRSNNTNGFTTVVEHILVYQKSDSFQPNLVEKGEEADARYKNPDDDPRGPWKAIPFLNPLSPEARPNLCYDIIQPNTGEILKNTKKAWRASKETFETYVEENRVWWGSNGKSNIPNIKRFLSEVRSGMPPINFWDYGFAGHTDIANAEIKDLFGEKVFDTPKPSQLIARVIEHAADKDDLILDSFAGSGTTGHAVLKMNQQDGGNRRFILVEMEPDIARKLTSERLRRVIRGYNNEKGNAISGFGGSFRYCELGEPLFNSEGRINDTVTFRDMAQHIFFVATGEPLPPDSDLKTPFLGKANGLGVYLLYNGILGDSTEDGGNVLTREVLANLQPFDGTRIIYGNGCLIGSTRLNRDNIIFRQIPYEVRVS